MRRGDERSHLGRVLLRVADLDAASRLDEQLREAVVDARLDEDPRARATILAGVVEDGVRRGGRCALEVGVGEHDVRGLAAELERDALDRAGCAAHHLLPDLGRPGEADLGDVRMLDQPRADDGALAREDVDDALRNAGLERELAEPDRREGCQLRGLEHDRVAAGERRPELPGGDVEREVPGDDQPHDAERLAEGQVDAARDGDRLAEVLVDRARVVVEDLRDHADLAARALDRLADVARLEPCELLAVLLDERREPPQKSRPVGGRDGTPGRERLLRAGDGRVRLLDAGRLDLGDRLLRRRVDDGGHLRAASTSCSNRRWSSPASGCQSTPTRNGFSGSSTASTIPSSAQATSRSPSPIRPRPWW